MHGVACEGGGEGERGGGGGRGGRAAAHLEQVAGHVGLREGEGAAAGPDLDGLGGGRGHADDARAGGAAHEARGARGGGPARGGMGRAVGRMSRGIGGAFSCGRAGRPLAGAPPSVLLRSAVVPLLAAKSGIGPLHSRVSLWPLPHAGGFR